ncbi:uncharacterized protein DUF11 [Spirosoma oryzae]|uniref:Uncharacterized protein DUF11 n=1 Tax=Spirosoma oryzae TaxID=1469603 RepID=A0A2T0S0S3_9BACT|nr:Ig-like domain-containing protein [Spirosoma oryzae]PRY27029.1 uncharacterized protein DUF11 [Spirosoma oryzae]
MKKFSTLLWTLLLIALSSRFAAAQVKYRIGLDADKQTYRVYMTSTSSYTGNAGRISTAQVTILVPHGSGSAQFTVTNLQGKVVGSQSMTWSQNARVNAPTENPAIDYISFGFSGSASPVLFDIVANQEIELFSFKNTGSCLGAVTLFDNQTDVFQTPNSQNTNPGNQLTVLGRGPGNAYTGNYGTGASCSTTVADLTASITGPSTLTVGSSGTYSVQVTNAGTASTAGIITVTAGIPTGLSYAGSSGTGWGCSVGTASAGTTPVSCTTSAVLASSAGSTITLSLIASLVATQPLTIAGSVSGGSESNTSNDAFSQAVTIQAAPTPGIADLNAAIVGPASLAPAAPATLTLTVGNVGSSLYAGTTTTQTLVPTGLTYTGATGTGWTCGTTGQSTGTLVTCTSIQPVSAGGSLPAVYINVAASTGQTTAVQLPVSGTVTGAANDNVANNTYGITIAVSGMPTVSISSPTNNGTTTTSPTVSGTATPGSQVTITGPGNTILCTTMASASGSYSCAVTVSAGPNSITAIACSAGSCSLPVVSTFTAATTTPPGLTVAQPQPGPTTQPISGAATPGSTIIITGPGNATLCTTTASTSGSFTCLVTVPSGPSSVTVTACNTGGCTSQPVNITGISAPAVSISSPTNNGTTTTSPTVSGTATPGSQVTITGPGNTILCTTMASASGSYSCAVTVSAGPNSITAVACSAGGCSSPAMVGFTAVTTTAPPNLTVVQSPPGPTTQPISGAATPGSTITITGPGNATLCTTTASTSGSFTCLVTVPSGPSSVTVTACNTGGCTAQPVTVTATSGPTSGTADISTTISLSTKAPNQFEAITATIIVTNSGPDSATGIVDKITLPTGQPVTASSASVGTFNQTTGLWNIGTLAAGQSVTLTIGLSAATGGVATVQSEIVASGQYDPDSTPNNQQYGEDDLAVACFSVPVDLCQGETFTFSITGSFTSIQWYRNGQPIAQATTTSLVINQEGTYTVSTNVNCPSGGCCPLIVRLRPAGSCCQPARCVPFVITKRTR